MPTSSAVRATNLTTVATLAEQLHDGPLKSLAALQVRARVLAAADEGSGSARLEHLAHLEEMVRLAQCAMVQFHEFTTELLALVERVAEQSVVSQ
jgi:hypothetical protein